MRQTYAATSFSRLAHSRPLCNPRSKRSKSGQAVCRSCKHGVGYHKDRTGHCHKPVGIMRDPCDCRHYDGPTPLPEYYAPEIGA